MLNYNLLDDGMEDEEEGTEVKPEEEGTEVKPEEDEDEAV